MMICYWCVIDEMMMMTMIKVAAYLSLCSISPFELWIKKKKKSNKLQMLHYKIADALLTYTQTSHPSLKASSLHG